MFGADCDENRALLGTDPKGAGEILTNHKYWPRQVGFFIYSTDFLMFYLVKFKIRLVAGAVREV